jgi:SulP family sulfate permease
MDTKPRAGTPVPRTRRRRLFPFLAWRDGYGVATFRRDVIAGITVAVVLVPQSMAYALLAGLPAQYGLYAALVTPVVGALWGSLRQLATGPYAITSLLVLTTLSPYAEPGSQAYVALAIQLAAMVGCIYLLLGALRLGAAMAFVSSSTVKGFNAAAALIIIATQLPHLLGLSLPVGGSAIGDAIALLGALPGLHPPTLALGLLGFVLIYGMKRRYPRIPAALIAVTALALVTWLLRLDLQGVQVLGAVPGGLPVPRVPSLRLDLVPALLGPAFVIGLVGFTGTYAVGRSVSDRTHQRVDVNQELIGQGLANLVGSLFQGYPVSGSFSRTALGFAAGARTGVSSLVSSLVVLLALLFVSPLLGQIPRAALAAVVIAAVLLLFHPVELFTLWRKSRADGVVAVTVFVLALLVKPDYALLIGVIVSLALFLLKSMHPRVVVVTRRPGAPVFVNRAQEDLPACPQLCMVRVDDAIYFANAEYTMLQVRAALDAAGGAVRHLVLDMKGVGFVDLTGAEELGRLHHEIRDRGVGLALVGLHLPVHRLCAAVGLLDRLGPGWLFQGYQDAVDALFPSLDPDHCLRACPYRIFEQCPSPTPPGP